MRVVRGPDWNLGDEDGGEGHVGTVTGQVGDDNVKVVWDGGQVSTCRGGLKKGTHDLRVLDNGTVGEYSLWFSIVVRITIPTAT